MRFLLKKLLVLYKKILSPAINAACIYTPSCSMYMYDAVTEYGAIRGFFMGVYRVLRCNPWARGGYDPVKYNLRGNIKWVL